MAAVAVEACIDFSTATKAIGGLALTAKQEEAVREFVKGNDILVSFPTKNLMLAEPIASTAKTC